MERLKYRNRFEASRKVQTVEAYAEMVELQLTKTQIHMLPYKHYEEKSEFHRIHCNSSWECYNRVHLPGTPIYSQWYTILVSRWRVLEGGIYPPGVFQQISCVLQ